MQLRIGIILCSLLTTGATLSGCAGGPYKSFMEQCTDNAKNEAERSQCAWENASRMASGK